MRNVLVTGASRGLGLAIARRLARDGFRVLALARSPGPELPEFGDAVRFHPVDLAETDALGPLVRTLRRAHGPIFGLVNNAGASLEGLLANTPAGDIERLVRLNTLSPILLTKFVARGMMADGGGRIVAMSSIMAETGYSGLAAYGATKASMIGFTKSLARELGPLGITVNAVAPGFVDTDLTRSLSPEDRARVARRSALGVLATPDDVAGAVSYLMGPDAARVTGTVLTVDAGATA